MNVYLTNLIIAILISLLIKIIITEHNKFKAYVYAHPLPLVDAVYSPYIMPKLIHIRTKEPKVVIALLFKKLSLSIPLFLNF